MLSIFNKRRVAKFRSKVAVLVSWNLRLITSPMSLCTYTSRKCSSRFLALNLSLTGCSGPRPDGVAHAKELCEELLDNVKAEYQSFKERPPQHRFNNDGYSNGRSGSGYGDRPPRERNHSYGHGNYGNHGGYGGTTEAQATNATNAGTHSSYASYYSTAAQGGTDPYAQYGGYENYMAWHNYYYQQAQQTNAVAGPGGAVPTAADATPGAYAPAGTPSSGTPSGGYHSVCLLSSV